MIKLGKMRVLLLVCSAIASSQQGANTASAAQSPPASSADEPLLKSRPTPKPGSPEGRIQLDVLVTTKQGGPVAGLDPKDFIVLDNKKSQSILSFRPVDVAPQKADPEAQVILLLDLLNASFEQAGVVALQMTKYLQQNGGHLAYPTSIAIISDQGVRLQPTPSTDGNRLAAQLNATMRTLGPAAARLDEVDRFQSSLKTLLSIAASQAKTPNRKILIWPGSGWPFLIGTNYIASTQDRKRYFDAIVEISTMLREAHISIYSIPSAIAEKTASLTASATTPMLMPSAEAPQQATRIRPALGAPVDGSSYKDFVRGVKSVHQAESGDLSLQVIAVQSGGRVLDPSNDLAGQIAQCARELGPFYRISFDPPQAEHSDDYHDLKVQIAKPGLIARTNTGFYVQP